MSQPTCDFCPNELRENTMQINMFGTDMILCGHCAAKASHNILEICDVCKSAGWVNCDWIIEDGVAHFVTTCSICRRLQITG